MKWWLAHLSEYVAMVCDVLEPFTEGRSFLGMTMHIGTAPMDIQPAHTWVIRFAQPEDALALASEWDHRFKQSINDQGRHNLVIVVVEKTNEHNVLIQYTPKTTQGTAP